ncbi:MAG TPA: DUF6584 family protein [Phycisphaerales bacterium]|nr:DUF6584 family protein [Phycisphaerales bacterium]
MSALDRAAHDEANGDLASARRRLASYLRTLAGKGGTREPLPSQLAGVEAAAQAAYRPEIIERVARLCLRMGDPAAAGQWYFLIDSSDEHAPASIARFEASRGHNPFQLWIALPPWARNLPLDAYPPAARERIARIMPPFYKQGPKRERRSKGERAADRALGFGCASLWIGVPVLALVGLVTVILWLVRLFQ